MSSKLLLPGGVALVAFLAWFIPFAIETNSIFNIRSDWSPYTAHVTNLQSKCHNVHPEQLKGCEDIHLVGSSIYTACVTDFTNRQKYWPRYNQLSTSPRSFSGDKLFRWDLATDSVIELELRNFPTESTLASERSFHGFDVNERADGTVSIIIINHIQNGSVIEKFHHDPTTNYATHVLRIPTTDPNAAMHPNDIFALPELDDDSAFFVTNDHVYADGYMKMVEMLGRRPWTWVSYYSASTGWKRAVEGMIGANGIAGDKNPVDRKIYVSEIFNGAVRAFSHKGADVLEEIQKVPVKMLGDNVARSGDDLYVVGPARGLPVGPYIHDMNFLEGPGMMVKRFSTKQIGSSFYGGGYTAPPAVEEIIMDGHGVLGNMSTTAIFVPYEAEKKERVIRDDDDDEEEIEYAEKPKGDLLVTGLTFKGILKCTNME
ncbi:hypothetical protein FPQ18DRAFT_280432 [Pyronema domesticum]|uniref:Similar to Serum paraoxonase/arylesterase 2 acc. no. Q58DS7 n=1 Tax=Pyronema omphalodes (strain CBS 100304) TaxID=1076935 RepID=U4KVL0_PYROM|nr:hypothetical protein FPQ18DRAFT_280432 [Pyronema domesticum]CCX04971.1 Similar to Serum paraoxonase/arylesterase 2; acc. no. Q58DS7 [Pyronema omphalodes CBS 100304]